MNFKTKILPILILLLILVVPARSVLAAVNVWNPICTGSPSNCTPGPNMPYMKAFNYSMPYVSSRGSLLFYGGYNNASTIYSNAIWEYKVSTHSFTRLSWSGSTDYSCPVLKGVSDNSEPNPPYWDGHPMSFFQYDSTRNKVLVYGLLCQGYEMHHTWSMDLGNLNWSEYINGGNPVWTGVDVLDTAMTYDPDHDIYISFGGTNPNNTLLYFSPSQQTWTNHTSDQNGTLPGANSSGYLGAAKFLYNSTDHKIYLYGGLASLGDGNSGQNDLFSFDPTTYTWTKINPAGGIKPPSGNVGQYPWIIYDNNRNRLVFYVDTGNIWQYSFANNTWSQLSITGGPTIPAGSGQPGYYGGLAGYDPVNDTMVIMKTGLAGAGNGGAPDVWELPFGTSTTTPLAGDLNNDHVINSLDWSIMNSQWFSTNPQSDLNHDGAVNSLDWSIMNSNWFKTY